MDARDDLNKQAGAHMRPVLLIAAHGERGGEGTNRRLAGIASEVQKLLPQADVRHGVLSGEPSIASALSGIDRSVPLTVFPLFMSEGYFVTQKLPAVLKGLADTWRMLEALGTGDKLARATAAKLLALPGEKPGSVLVVAHGSSKDDRSRKAAEAFAAHLTHATGGLPVDCCYLEEAPFAHDAVAMLDAGAALVSLFAGEGLHGGDDIPEILEKTGFPEDRVVSPAADIGLVAGIITSRFRQA